MVGESKKVAEDGETEEESEGDEEDSEEDDGDNVEGDSGKEDSDEDEVLRSWIEPEFPLSCLSQECHSSLYTSFPCLLPVRTRRMRLIAPLYPPNVAVDSRSFCTDLILRSK